MRLNLSRASASSRRGLGLIECVVSLVVMSMVGMVVGPVLNQAQLQARDARSTANLMSIGQGGSVYGAFNQDRIFSYTWRAGEPYMMPDGRVWVNVDDQAAAARQNTEILMRLTGRISGTTKILNFSGRLPHRRYSHLVLLDFLHQSLETTQYIDPADGKQVYWHANPLEYRDQENTLPYGSGKFPNGYDTDPNWVYPYITQRWTFASSYQVVPSAWQPEYPHVRYIPIASTPHLFTPSNTSADLDLHTGRRIRQVVFPSKKVWMFEEFDREQAGSPYFAYDHARSEKLMFDGSVNNWASGDANPSIVQEYHPFNPWNQAYVPLHQFPIPLGGLGDETLLNQRYRWTYRGLSGADYGAAELTRGPGIQSR